MHKLYIILVVFATLSCDTLFFEDTGNTPLETYDAFYQEVDRHFSFFPYLTEDFDSAYTANRVELENYPDDEHLVEVLSELVDFLKDGHTNVFTESNTLSYTGWYSSFPLNQLPDISKYFSSYVVKNRTLEYGLLAGEDIGYIRIRTFSGSLPTSYYSDIDYVLSALSNTDAIVIDVRSNGGGHSNNADLITSRFNDASRFAFRSRLRTGENRAGFSGWWEKYTEVHEGNRYLKPVVVLTNRLSFSSTEWFVASMRTIPHVTVLGDTTGGGSGNPVVRQLPNGWTMRVSNSQKELPEGRDYQYSGIYPDIPVWITPDDEHAGNDTILEAAIELVKDSE